MEKQYRLWTDEEVGILKRNLHLTYKELGNKLDRSVSSIQKKIKGLGLLEERKKLAINKPLWRDEQVAYLKENYETATFVEMSARLGKSERTIRWKGNSLGLKRNHKDYKKWTSEDVEFLKENYGNTDIEIIARKLKKNVISVRQKANKLDLFVDHIPHKDTKGIKLKCTYIDNGQKKSRDIFYPTERCEKKAAVRAIDSLTNYMKFTDVKVVEARKL